MSDVNIFCNENSICSWNEFIQKGVSNNLVQIHCLYTNICKYNIENIANTMFCFVFPLNYLIMTKKEHRNLNKFLLDSSVSLVRV